MAEQPLHRRPDDELIDALRRLEPVVAWPVAKATVDGPDLAQAVRARIEASSAGARGSASSRPRSWQASPRWGWRPARRAMLIALLALIALVAIAGAAGLGLPGLRLLLGGGSVSPPPSLEPSRSPSPGAPGALMGLGDPMSPSDRAALDARAGFEVKWPADPLLGPPDAAYIDETKRDQVALVWAARPDLPATLEPGVGLVMTQFRGTVDDGFFDKVLNMDTTVESVRVSGQRGYWLSGEPHFFFYSGPDGRVTDDRRWVGDALIWVDGPITYRLESALGREATIRIAESLPQAPVGTRSSQAFLRN